MNKGVAAGSSMESGSEEEQEEQKEKKEKEEQEEQEEKEEDGTEKKEKEVVEVVVEHQTSGQSSKPMSSTTRGNEEQFILAKSIAAVGSHERELFESLEMETAMKIKLEKIDHAIRKFVGGGVGGWW